MQKKYYEIDGKIYDLRDICNTFNVSRATFLRKVEKGLPLEECVKKNTTYKDYKGACKKRDVNWPADLVADIFENAIESILKENYRYDLDEIIDHFEERIKVLYDNNRNSFRQNEIDMIYKYYKKGYTVVEIAKEYELTKQRVSTIINTYLRKFKNRVYLQYLLKDMKKIPLYGEE
ncbi:MAG: hypothetical protein K6D97_08700 [Clostridia bacterium]|nr:hypothetical protein [Clostridia bacterium]